MELYTESSIGKTSPAEIRFTAPEFIQDPERIPEPSKSSDVYAFSMLMLQEVIMELYIGHRPDRTKYPPAMFTALTWALMNECWNHEPSARPGMASIALRLERACVESAVETILPPPKGRLYDLAKAYNGWTKEQDIRFASDSRNFCFDYPKDEYAHIKDISGKVTRVDDFIFDNGGCANIWRGSISEGGIAQLVVVKVSRCRHVNEWQERNQDLLKEAAIWNELHHPNILPFYGICFGFDVPSTPGLVSPYYKNLHVIEYLRTQPDADKIALICQAAAGLSYMHSRNIIHGDVKSVSHGSPILKRVSNDDGLKLNILVNDEQVACICDFGFSRLFEDDFEELDLDSAERRQVEGSYRWMDGGVDETTEGDSHAAELGFPIASFKAKDTWAFSMTILEIMSGKLPFYWIKSTIAAWTQVMIGVRPTRNYYPEIEDDRIWLKLSECWAEREHRPPMESLRVFFEEMRETRTDPNDSMDSRHA
ncbi:hypothetical protein HWV62_11574 [Athelia sp. TMB]|nr:hypothetical protein HWV62_11574 [Athelia sp. TMB]